MENNLGEGIGYKDVARTQSDYLISEYVNLLGWVMNEISAKRPIEGTPDYNRLRQLYYCCIVLGDVTKPGLLALPQAPSKALPNMLGLYKELTSTGLYKVGMVRA